MKFLVTGATGLVGRQVVHDLLETGADVYSAYHEINPEAGIPTQMDLTNQEKISETITRINPDSIIHLAALTDVDYCEKEKDLAMKLNAKATEIISKQAAKHKAFFVYVSTDYVFDGENGMKKETDATNPVNFYGKSKLEGEKSVMNLASSWCIARTSTPFGIHPKKKSFPLFVTEQLKNNNEIKVMVEDEGFFH